MKAALNDEVDDGDDDGDDDDDDDDDDFLVALHPKDLRRNHKLQDGLRG